MESGKRLGKTDFDILHAFIAGLPERLAFFVRASKPGRHENALEMARSGEAYGYRSGLMHIMMMEPKLQHQS